MIGAASAGWTPLRFNEWFDNDFPDWLEIDSKEDALAGKSCSRDREFRRKRKKMRGRSNRDRDIYGVTGIVRMRIRMKIGMGVSR